MPHDPSDKVFLPKGVGSALLAALLFGVSTPIAKIFLDNVSPVLLTSLFYLGSGFGLTILYVIRRGHPNREAFEARRDIPWLGGALLFGGILGPILLMAGASKTTAWSASILLNMESVFTVVLAWFIFRESYDLRIALGMGLILARGFVLSFHGAKGASYRAVPSRSLRPVFVGESTTT